MGQFGQRDVQLGANTANPLPAANANTPTKKTVRSPNRLSKNAASVTAVAATT